MVTTAKHQNERFCAGRCAPELTAPIEARGQGQKMNRASVRASLCFKKSGVAKQ